jgi:F-type H+-transporting ATPase subunit delta
VTNKAAANRYARALFDVALKEKVDLQSIDDQLAGFVSLLHDHPTLEKALLNPAVPASRKRLVVDEIAASAKVQTVLAKLLALLAERDRLVLLPDLLASYRDRVLDHRQVVRAEVTTAEPLSAERTKAIEKSLADITGRGVALTTRVEPAIVGGLVARVGGTVYDASVTTQLEKIRQRLRVSR